MNFGIIYSYKNNSQQIKYANTEQDAKDAAYTYMTMHTDIEQATIFNRITGCVSCVYAR